jgi:hypothetical protein
MKINRKYGIISAVILLLAGFLLGMYFLFPAGEKSEYFYVIVMTIVISGADEQFFSWIWPRTKPQKQEYNPLLSEENKEN